MLCALKGAELDNKQFQSKDYFATGIKLVESPSFAKQVEQKNIYNNYLDPSHKVQSGN